MGRGAGKGRPVTGEETYDVVVVGAGVWKELKKRGTSGGVEPPEPIG